MPFALYVDVIPEGGGKISVGHVFYGETEEECQENWTAHAGGCKFLTAAIDEKRVSEELETISESEWPDYADPDEEDDEEEEGGEEEEDEEEE